MTITPRWIDIVVKLQLAWDKVVPTVVSFEQGRPWSLLWKVVGRLSVVNVKWLIITTAGHCRHCRQVDLML